MSAPNESMFSTVKFVCLCLTVVGCTAMSVTRTYRDPHGDSIQDMHAHPLTQNLFVGGKNSITRLSPDLTMMDRTFISDVNSDVFSKGMYIDTRHDILISCTTHFNGSCQFRSLQNISSVIHQHLQIVPSNPGLDNIIFLGPSIHGTNALYFLNSVHHDFSPKDILLSRLPEISSRELGNLTLAYSDLSGGTEKYILGAQVPKGFTVQYVYGFSHGNFVYFITSQHKAFNMKLGFYTKIIRLCRDDKYFNSYVEIPLDCLANSVTVFRKAKAAYFDRDSQHLYLASARVSSADDSEIQSALCVYNIDDINQEMNQTVQKCYDGSGSLGPSHIHKPSPCAQTSASPDMCSQSPVSRNYPSIEGKMPVFKTAGIVFPSSIVTSVIVGHDGSHTMVYLGMKEGDLKKIYVSSNGYMSLVDEIIIDIGQPLLRHMVMKDSNFLYVMTKSKVALVDTSHCDDKKTCVECTAAADPVCGWCVMENRCSKLSQCPKSSVQPHWLPAQQGMCASIRDMNPYFVNMKTLEDGSNQKQITFRLQKVTVLQPSVLDLHCTFVTPRSKLRTRASVKQDTVTCPLPPRTDIPDIPAGKVKTIEDHQVFEVEFQVEGRTIVKRDLSLYDCSMYQNCTVCTGSSFGCKWCYNSGTCTDLASGTCPQQSSGSIQSPDACPRLESSAQDTDILVHSGERKQIAVRVVNLKPEQTSDVKCQFKFLNETESVAGTVNVASSRLICDTLRFSFDDTALPYVTAGFKVVWGQSQLPLDNPRGIKVRIFKCPLMVYNCGQCLTMDPEYECGWCEDQCTLQKHCSKQWRDRSAICPNPNILRFSPSTGPVQGQTNISVTGINLGKVYSDLTVTVAGVQCHLHKQHYEPSSMFTCETEKSTKMTSGPITVSVNNQYTTTSASQFTFLEPELRGLSPMYGPKSGGTTINIEGANIDAGTKRTVTVGGSDCDVISHNKTSLNCKTSQWTASDKRVKVEVNFGGLEKFLPDSFTYQDDPVITMVDPTQSILSGGTTLTVMGTGLDFIQEPEMFFELGDRRVTSPCTKLYQVMGWLVCNTPKLSFMGVNVTATSPHEVHYGFNLDGVMMYKNISENPEFGPVRYYPDPVVVPYGSPKQYKKGQHLVIKGQFLSVNRLMADAVITVGGEKCKGAAATDDTISCEAPEKPGEINSDGNAMVRIQIGHFQTDIGYLKYFTVEEPDRPIAIGIILGVVLPIIAIIILLTICVIRRHRKHKPSENFIPDVLKDYEGKKEEEELGMNHVSVKADMNGSVPDDKDTGPYIAELLSKVDDEVLKQRLSDFLIPRKQLDVGELLAKGNFGVTYKATYCQGQEGHSSDVIVKTMQGSHTDSENILAYLQHCVLYKDVQHSSVMPLCGVCLTASDDPLVVMPFAYHKDLKSFVRDSNKNLTVLELLEMGEQVAQGMAYLQDNHIIHRNLAARNCLVCEDGRVVVSEFGLSVELFGKEQYVTEEGRPKSLVKWIAPEAMDSWEFTHQSDVWSYGVLLWELLTRGVTPYPDVDTADLRSYLTEGNRLKKPRQCPENIYELMLRCWAINPSDRPTFQQIVAEIQTFISSGADNSTEEGEPLQAKIDVDSSAEFV